MIDLLDLYNKGHRRFLFSDGVVREPILVDLKGPSKQPLKFSFNNGSCLWYKNNGVNNINADYPHVIGSADSPAVEGTNLKRDEDGRWWIEVPLSATVEDITKAQEVLCSKT